MTFNNPFHILDAAMSDSKAVIHDKAEEKSFLLPEEDCRKAEQILINPRKRLAAEVAWFPGVGARKVAVIFQQIDDDMKDFALHFARFNAYPKLAYANIIALYLCRFKEVSAEYEFEDIGIALKMLITEFCSVINDIDVEQTFDLINQERLSAGFPEMTNFEDFEFALDERLHECKTILLDFLGVFDLFAVADILASVIEKVTKKGSTDCPWQLLSDLISDYEIKAIPEFEKCEKEIDKEIGCLKQMMGTARVDSIGLLDKYVKEWDRLAQPIQVLLRSQGKDHLRTKQLSKKLRDFAIYAHNKCKRTDISLEVTKLQEKVFSELRSVSETVKADEEQLSEMIRTNAWRDSMLLKKHKSGGPYNIEWGFFFSKSVNIDSKDIIVNIKGTHTYLVNDVIGVSWGAMQHYIRYENYPSYRKYCEKYRYETSDITYHVDMIFKNKEKCELEITKTQMERIASALTYTVLGHILENWLVCFAAGKTVRVGNFEISDRGVSIIKDHFISHIIPWKKLTRLGNCEEVKYEETIVSAENDDSPRRLLGRLGTPTEMNLTPMEKREALGYVFYRKYYNLNVLDLLYDIMKKYEGSSVLDVFAKN